LEGPVSDALRFEAFRNSLVRARISEMQGSLHYGSRRNREPSVEMTECGRRHRTLRSAVLDAELQRAVFRRIHLHAVAVQHAAIENAQRQRVLYQPLDRTLVVIFAIPPMPR